MFFEFRCILSYAWILGFLSFRPTWSVDSVNVLQLVLFNESYSDAKNARCLDGSPGGFYWKKETQEDKWVIFLEGGGLCLTPKSCQSRTRTSLGSSSLWDNTTQGFGLTSYFESENPTFYSWNHVFIPYCSGDLWSGTITEPLEATFNFYFSGHLNLVAVLDYLIENHGLGSSLTSEVVFAGESAGGVGVLNNVDQVAAMLPRTRVMGVPIGGWYYPKVSLYPAWRIHLNIELGSLVPYALYRSFVNQDCAQQHKEDPWYCGPVSATSLYDHIKSPLFIAENMFDSDQLFDELECPKENTTESNAYMLYYGEKMREAMKKVLTSPKRDGLYMPSCLSHTDHLVQLKQTPVVNGQTFPETLNSWYRKDSHLTQLVDRCSFVNCNPTCSQVRMHPPG